MLKLPAVGILSLTEVITIHNPVFFTILFRGQNPESINAETFLVIPGASSTLNSPDALVSQTNFSDQFDVETAFSYFYNTLLALVDKHASLKTVSNRKLN